MSRHPKLPLRITLLLGLVLIITVLSALRVFTAIAWHATLAAYLPARLIFYVGLTGVIWTLAGCFMLWSLWQRARYAKSVLLVAAGLYAAWSWADRLLVQTGTDASWPFAMIATLALLAFVAVVGLDPRNQFYFRRESHDRKPEDPESA